MLPGDKELLDTDDIAAYLGVHRRTVQRWVRTGELPAMKIGVRFKIRREDLLKFLDERKLQPKK
jgi:excisionase family DNA binding protein